MNRNVLTLAVLGCSQLAIAQNIEKPNFALFIADECSYYDLGCYGSSDSITPNIDNFAEEGMMFSKAITDAYIHRPAVELYDIKEEIFFADPTVFVQDGTYYLTGTRNAEPLGFQLLKSDDLRFWKEAGADTLGLVLRKDHTAFGEKGFWAPQILKHNGRYLMTYTASEQTALARSESIGGPYTQEIIEPIDGSEKNIDSFLFKDEDGKYYLYHVRFYNGNYIWVAEFDIDKGKIKPETLKKCFDCTEEWERTSNYESEPIMEGPTVIKKDGFYYLFYSANHFKNIDYAVGYATAPTPFGPWTKSQNSPIIHRSIVGENGSGHGDLFQDKEGNYWYVFHVHNSDTEIDPRRTRIIPLKFTLNEKTGIYDITADANSIIIPLKNE